MSESTDRIPASLRTEALEQLLTERGLVDPKVLDSIITTYETNVGPLNGAKVIAKAWTDPKYRRWLLDDGTAAIRQLGYIGVQTEHVVVVENTATSHHVVVCTLCSCYPWQLLGLPPSWYKDPAYRARIVREPRKVLSEMGLELADDVGITVHDSSEVRWLVLPKRPAGRGPVGGTTRAADHPRCDGRRGQDLGTMSLPMDIEGPAALPRSNGELVFAEPWESRAFAMAVALCEVGVFTWREFQAALVARIAGQDDTSIRWCYYGQWLGALEDVLAGRSAVGDHDVTARARAMAQRPAGHDHAQR